MNIQQAKEKLEDLKQEVRDEGVPSKEEVIEMIRELCAREGPQFTNYMIKKASIENNNFDPTGDNYAGSGAAGIYQIIRSNVIREWKNNPSFNPYNAKENILWTIRFTKQNSEVLKNNNLPITPINLYMLHQQGPTGGVAIIKGVENGLDVRDLPSDIQSNIGTQFNLKTREVPSYIKTCEDFVNYFGRKFEDSNIAKSDWTKSKNLITTVKPNEI